MTPIQLATAYAAMVNGGRLVKPHVVKAIGNNEIPLSTGEEVLSKKLSRQLTGLLDHVVTEGPSTVSRR